jgi:NAD(P)-dependent dehydrogenase (short-subunit alcohol dehydrogenase family)
MAKNTKPDEDGERGIIILTASIAGIDTQPRMIAYSVGKAGTAALTLPLARDLSPFGIRVMSIAPGTFATPLFGTMPAHVRESFGAAVVWPKRVGKPPEYASLACHMIVSWRLVGFAWIP